MLYDIATLIHDRADINGGAKNAAILTAVADFAAAFSGPRKRRFDLRQCQPIRAPRHQEVKVLAEYFVAFVARQQQEAVIRKNDRIFRYLGISKHHCHTCRFGSHNEWAMFLSKAFDFGFCVFLLLGFFYYF